MSTSATLRTDPALLDSLREDLAGAPFGVDEVRERLGALASAALGREQTLPARRAVAGASDPLGVLIGCFGLGLPTAADDLASALPRTGVTGAVALGIVEPEGAHVRATCDLRPYGDDSGHAWWVASDPTEHARSEPLPVDHVLGIGGASTTLASWTPRTHVARALDLGTGCGVQALHLSTHAEHVVATDLSRRALGYAAFNAALNRADWDLREGSFLEPVAGEAFDLVVSNPPFVITPRSGDVPLYEYRDGGAAGDAVVAALTKGVGAHLAPGGVAQLLGNWETGAGQDWRDRVGEWVAESGLDAWVVQRDVQDPAEYAELWTRDGGHLPGTSEHDTLVGAWLDDFASRRVEQIGFGIITLHRPTTQRTPFVDLVEAHGPVATPMGPTIAAGLVARDRLAGLDDDALLDTAWRCADDVTTETHAAPGATDPNVIVLRQGGGLARSIRLDTLDAALVSVSDGELTARQSLTAISALLDLPTGEALGAGATLVRRLAADGLILPA
ncbi:methyltransferase [Janibacter terrae]|uniref:Methyltransferase n=1 Tax=Janibacter terrae TaxID=103817 RepID=A0ABZ2FB54_9MICO